MKRISKIRITNIKTNAASYKPNDEMEIMKEI